MRATLAPVLQGFVLMATLGLAGCLSLPDVQPDTKSSLSSAEASLSDRSLDLIKRARQRERVKLVQGHVIVQAPEGYCAEKSTRRVKDFVLLGDCNVLREAESGLKPYERGLLTVSAGPVTATAPTLDSLKAGLEAFGAPKQSGKLITVHIQQGGDQLVPGADAVYWRGVTVVNNRVISLAAFGPPYSDLSLTKGRALLQDLAANIHAESPRIDPQTLAATPVAEFSESVENPTKPKFAFLGKIFK